MELEAVLGSINLIKTFRPIVITETLGVHAEKNKKIFNIFEKLNYQIIMLNESCAAFDFFDKSRCRNYVFMPREHLATLHHGH